MLVCIAGDGAVETIETIEEAPLRTAQHAGEKRAPGGQSAPERGVTCARLAALEYREFGSSEWMRIDVMNNMSTVPIIVHPGRL